MNKIAVYNGNEAEYLNALETTRDFGSFRRVRNGATIAIFAHQMRFNLQKGFPVLTTKQVAFRMILAELIWLLDAGKETGHRLSIGKFNKLLGKPEDAENIWTGDQLNFAEKGKDQFKGDCGRIYGAMWRDWTAPDGTKVDQLANVIRQLKIDPFSRYHIVNAWNPGELADMCLPPCHMKMQFFVRQSKRRDKKMYLDISMDQRSCDLFLGVPFNIASYALLLHMVAQCVDMIPGELIMTLEDCHIYKAGVNEKGNLLPSKSHLGQVNEQLSRTPYKAPTLWLNPEIKDIDCFTMDDAKLLNYHHQGALKASLLTKSYSKK